MGYSPWGHKESDMTERLIHSLSLSYDMCVYSLSRVRLLATPWTAAHQASLSMGLSRQEYWSGVPLTSPETLLSTLKWMSLEL